MTTGADEAELAAVGEHHDLAARAADHGELDRRHGDARRRQTRPGVEAVGSEERLVGVEVLDHVERPGALDRVELRAVEAAQKDELEPQAPRLGGRRQAVGDDARLEVGGDVTQHVHHGRARAEEHGVARLDHGGGGPGDAVLFGRVGRRRSLRRRARRSSCRLRTAPPWVRARMPSCSRSLRSRRMVISETPRSSLSAVTRTAGWALRAATIRARLSAGSISRTPEADKGLLPEALPTPPTIMMGHDRPKVNRF